MRLVIVGISCAALGVALAAYLEARALRGTVEGLAEAVSALSARAEEQRVAEHVTRTIIEQRMLPAVDGAPAAVERPVVVSAPERFDRDGGADPRRRADMVSTMRNAGLDVDSIECTATMCAIAATTPPEETARFVDAVSDAIGPGVVLEMVYADDGPGRRRVTVYAR